MQSPAPRPLHPLHPLHPLRPPRYPAPLRPGARIAVTAPSSGVEPAHQARLDVVIAHLRAQGFVVEEGRCLRSHRFDASAPAAERAAELMHFLLRDDIAAVFPPWGGELAIELLPRLDWAALAAAQPKWLIGFSDTSTLLLPLTLRLGWATAHGPGLMDLAPSQHDALTTQVMAHLATPTGGAFTQQSSTHWQRHWTDFAVDPQCSYRLTEATAWRCLNRAEDDPTAWSLQGRLLGGCLDTLMHLAGTPFGDVPRAVAADAADAAGPRDGVLLYLENSDQDPVGLLRALMGLRMAGWFDGIRGLLLGRSAGPEATSPDALQAAMAVHQAVGDLPCPVIADADIGHLPPQMLLINGALAALQRGADGSVRLTQTLA